MARKGLRDQRGHKGKPELLAQRGQRVQQEPREQQGLQVRRAARVRKGQGVHPDQLGLPDLLVHKDLPERAA